MANINLHHLRLFRAVAQDGTLTGAARSLNISQSAVSTQIRALESALGHDLFERNGRSLLLTEAGRIALDHAEEIFLAADNLSATLRTSGAKRQALRVGALSTLSRNFQLAFLEPIIGRDDVEVVLRSGSQESMLRGLDAPATGRYRGGDDGEPSQPASARITRKASGRMANDRSSTGSPSACECRCAGA